MKKQLKFGLMLRLEEIALRKLAIVLWSETDVLTLIAKFQKLHYLINFYDETWENTVVDVVENKMIKLQLPELITQQMIPIIQFIGSHILNWKMFQSSFLDSSLGVRVLEKLCFTTAGAVDYQNTAETLVHSDVLDIVSRYKLACLYCLEDYIPDLWNKLPEDNKIYFYDKKVTISDVDTFLWFLWPYILKEEEHKLDCASRSSRNQASFRQFAFEYSAIRGNRAACEYFLRKLSPEERDGLIIRAANNTIENVDVDRYIYDEDDYEALDNYPKFFPREKVSDILCYLLSLMTYEQQMQIFKEKPSKVLRFFLQWPWQIIFLNNADVISTLFPNSDFDIFFWSTINIIYLSEFQELKLDFSLLMKNNFKKYFVNHKRKADDYFFHFLEIADTENIRFILKNIDAAEKVELLSSYQFFYFYERSNHEGRCHLVEMCLLEALLSKDDTERVKEAFTQHLQLFDLMNEGETQQLRKIFEFLCDIDTRAKNKRSSDNDTLKEVKKMCSEFKN